MTNVPESPHRSYTVDASGITLAVTDYAPVQAEAPVVVLVHGIGSRGVSWFPVIDDLARTFRVITFDLRGHGESAKPEAGYLLPDYVRDLDGLLDALQIDHPRIIGHSLGGLTTLRWAADHPAKATAIVLEDTALSGGPSLRPAFDGWLALSKMTVEQAAAWYASEYPHWSEEDCIRRAQSITSVHPRVFEELRDESTSVDRPPRLFGFEKITSPMMLVHGDVADGSMVQPEDARRLAQMVPALRIARIPGVGHNVHRDARESFVATVVPFLLGN
jgi:pimeloyl-ACP methyl ester carboxylesterase